MNHRKFRIIVVGIIENTAHRIMLIKRAKAPGKNLWALPGGSVEFGENSNEAVKREIKEETGLDFDPVYNFNHDDFLSVPGFHSLVICYFGFYSGKVSIRKEEISDYRFFSPHEIHNSTEIAFSHRDLVLEYLKIKKTHSNLLHFNSKEKTMQSQMGFI